MHAAWQANRHGSDGQNSTFRTEFEQRAGFCGNWAAKISKFGDCPFFVNIRPLESTNDNIKVRARLLQSSLTLAATHGSLSAIALLRDGSTVAEPSIVIGAGWSDTLMIMMRASSRPDSYYWTLRTHNAGCYFATAH